MHPRQQTIFALSSGRPPSAIAVVRVSGPQAGPVLAALAGKMPAPRLATRVLLREANQQPIDDAVVLWFPGPASATGEDVAEFHVHGGRAVLAALLAALSNFADMRAAEPGEFTRRAFENGKLDLTEAEGLDDLIHADTDRQRRQALRQLKGLLGDRARNWRDQIIEASALIEAGIDFSDEGDVSTELIAPASGEDQNAAGRDRGSAGGAGAKRTAARGAGGRDRRSAECRQVHADECAGAARGGDRVAACGHHAGRDRGAARSRWLSGDGDRHRRDSRDRRSRRAGRRAPGEGAGGGSRPGVVDERSAAGRSVQSRAPRRCGGSGTRSTSMRRGRMPDAPPNWLVAWGGAGNGPSSGFRRAEATGSSS